MSVLSASTLTLCEFLDDPHGPWATGCVRAVGQTASHLRDVAQGSTGPHEMQMAGVLGQVLAVCALSLWESCRHERLVLVLAQGPRDTICQHAKYLSEPSYCAGLPAAVSDMPLGAVSDMPQEQ